MGDITAAERKIMAHSLGMKDGNKRPYRNYFCAEDGHTDMPLIRSLIAKGMMFEGRGGFYHVTDAGCALLGTTREEAER